MDNKKRADAFFKVPSLLLILAIVAEKSAWLVWLGGGLMIGCSIYAMVETYQKGFHKFNYVMYALLIAACVYMITIVM